MRLVVPLVQNLELEAIFYGVSIGGGPTTNTNESISHAGASETKSPNVYIINTYPHADACWL